MASNSETKVLWNFPSNNNGQISGISDSGVETFNGTPIKSLAREICQNSIDAKRDDSIPVRVVFHTFEIESSKLPNIYSLQDACDRALAFWLIQSDQKAKEFFYEALRVIEQKKIRCLRISDYNTTGLGGSDKEYNSAWSNLTKSQGASDKSGVAGGSFGIGKFAPYACSKFRTVIYSTLDDKGISAYQGVSRLTSFKNENDDITQGTGYYGGDKNTPVKAQFVLDPNIDIRDIDQSGTDIYVLGFNGDDNWKNEMVASVLDSFLYAIVEEKLIVEVDNIIINKENLPNLIKSHERDFKEHADKYYSVLTSNVEMSPFFTKSIDNYGNVSLRLMIKPDLHRRVAMVRKTGMKIMDKSNISGIIPFAGVLYIEGDGLNKFLRTLENPQHTKWEIERAKNKTEAKRILESLTKFIKESLDLLKNDDSEESIDAPVGTFLPDDFYTDVLSDNSKSEKINDKAITIEVITKPYRPNRSNKSPNGDETGEMNDLNGTDTSNDAPGNGVGNGANVGDGQNQDNGTGTQPNEQPKTQITVISSKTRVMCISKSNGEYEVAITPSQSLTNGFVELYLVAESHRYPAEIISAKVGDENMLVSGNRIAGLTFVEKQLVRLSVRINYYDYCSMEVKSYGN